VDEAEGVVLVGDGLQAPQVDHLHANEEVAVADGVEGAEVGQELGEGVQGLGPGVFAEASKKLLLPWVLPTPKPPSR